MGSLVTTEDVAGLWRPFTEAEIGPAGNLINVASAIIRGRIPVDAMLADGQVSIDVVAFVVKEMIATAVDSIGTPTGARSVSETAGIYSHTITYDTVATASSSMVLDDRLLAMLVPPSTARVQEIGSIRLQPSLAPCGDYRRHW